MNKTVLITGASSGFGKLAVQKFQAEGWNVAATMRSPEKGVDLAQLENVEVMRLDVTNPQSIQAAVDDTTTRFGSLHAVVNNAGYGGHGMLEEFTDAEVRAMHETNLFGALNVMRTALPIFRSQNEGTIVNVTSLAGFISGPTGSIYASTKHALEAVTEGAAAEYAPLGIKICSVAPGAFVTGFTSATKDGTAKVDSGLRAYADQLQTAVGKMIEGMYATAGDPSQVSDKIFECVTQKTPVRNVVGHDAEAIAAGLASMPRQEFLDNLRAQMIGS